MFIRDLVDSIRLAFDRQRFARRMRPPVRRRRRWHLGFIEPLEGRALLAAPVFAPDTYTFSIAEDAADDASVGTVTALDTDLDFLAYEIESGDSDYQFAVDEYGNITVDSELDYEEKASYTLTVSVSDGISSDSATVTINVTDVDEAPTFDEDHFDIEVDEDEEIDAIIFSVGADDPENGNLSYSITGGDPNGDFTIDDDGDIKLAAALDAATTGSYELTIEVSDGVNTNTTTVTIEILVEEEEEE